MMDHATLQELVLLTNFEMDSRLPFILLMIGQPELKDMLARSIHEPLRQRISLRYHMAGLSVEELSLSSRSACTWPGEPTRFARRAPMPSCTSSAPACRATSTKLHWQPCSRRSPSGERW